MASYDVASTYIHSRPGLVTSILGVQESVRICPNLALYRIRPNPEFHLCRVKLPIQTVNHRSSCGVVRNPPESDPLPNPSESGNAIPVRGPTHAAAPHRHHVLQVVVVPVEVGCGAQALHHLAQRRHLLGTDRYCSPRHRMPFHSRHEGCEVVVRLL